MNQVALDDLSIVGLLSNWLDREWEARFIIDERLAMLWNNGSAVSWLNETNCTLRTQNGLLAAKDSKLQYQLTELIASARRETAWMLIGGRNEPQELLFSARQVGQFGGYKCVGLSVRSIEATDTHELIGLGDAFNLTPSEEAVLQKMMQGHTVERIALSSRTSQETVRTHVRRAYSKMSVSSREEMFSRLKPFLFDR